MSVPHICPGIPRILSRQRNSKKSCKIVKLKTSIKLWGATAMHNIMYGTALTVTVDGRLWWNFHILRIWRFKSGKWASLLQWRLVRGDRYYRRALWVRESIIGYESSSEPSFSNQRYILFTLFGSVPLRLIRNPRGTNWGLFRFDLKDRLVKTLELNLKNEAGLWLVIYWFKQALTSN